VILEINTSTTTGQSLINKFICKNKFMTFALSPSYIDLQEQNGLKVSACGIFTDTKKEGKELSSLCIYSIVSAKRGTALQVVHGPLIPGKTDENLELYRQYLQFLEIVARKNKCDYIRVNPVCGNSLNLKEVFKKLKYHPTPYENLPFSTNFLDLEDFMHRHAKTSDLEGTFYASYSKSCRDNLRKLNKLEKDGSLVFKHSETLPKEAEEIYKSLVKKNNYSAKEFESVSKETVHYSKDNLSFVALAYYNKKLVAFATFIKNHKKGLYVANHHSASIMDKAIVGSNNFTTFLHHKSIQHMAKDGISIYDFWGVNPTDQPKHPWANFSKFKRSFQGQDYAYMPGQDLPLTPKYWITNLYERYQKTRRGH
jgi:FemAB family